jgi:hypothetical protein
MILVKAKDLKTHPSAYVNLPPKPSYRHDTVHSWMHQFFIIDLSSLSFFFIISLTSSFLAPSMPFGQREEDFLFVLVFVE